MHDMKEQGKLLDGLNAKADSLLAKLADIKAAIDSLPSEDELSDLLDTAGRIADSLNQAKETYQSDGFPGEATGLDEAANQAALLSDSLTKAAETFASEDFPSEENIKDVRLEAEALAESLAQANGAE